MKMLVVSLAFLILRFTILCSAQGSRPGAGSGNSKTPNASAPNLPTVPPVNQAPRTLFLTGKVAIDDGTQLTEAASVRTICKGQARTQAYTDAHGNFSFELGGPMPMASAGIDDADTSFDHPSFNNGVSPNAASGRQGSNRQWHDCELQAVLAGFTSEVLELSSKVSELGSIGSVDVGRIVLHRLGGVQGFTVSATSGLAPSGAKKAFEKGREQEKKEKWDDAQRSFEKAVAIYPHYAVAWFELGRVEMRKKDLANARHCFEQAIAADSKYVSPYQALSDVAMQEQKWQEVLDDTKQVLALNPLSFPDAWFRNALGNYHLGNLAAAENSARQGIKVDATHQFPKMEYLLAVLLMKRAAYQESYDHMRAYSRLVTNPSDVDEAQKQLAEIARVSASAGAPIKESTQ
jgi:tetratricopeptide (TPR) repeat protein